MKRKFLLKTASVFMAAMSVLCVFGCAKEPEKNKVQFESKIVEESAESVKFVDDADNVITVAKNPTKVAVLFSSYVDVWQIAGGTVSVTVGESIEREFVKQEEVALVDSGAGKTIDEETLVSSKPDFVIGSSDIEAQTGAVKLMRESGVPSALFHVDTFTEYLSMLEVCCAITGNKIAYQEYGLNVGEEIEKIISDSQGKEEKKILFVRCASKLSNTKAKTKDDHFAAHMLYELGTHNIAEDAPVLLDGLSMEAIISANPDFLFFSTMGNEEAAKNTMNAELEKPEWQALSAVKEGKYVYLPKDLFQFKPNAKWAEAYKYLFDLLYN